MSEAIFYKLSQKYRTPLQVQQLLRSFKYNHKDTVHSALTVYQRREAHCLEGAFFAAAILEHQGYPPCVLSLESQDNLDHVLFIYQNSDKWGAVGMSRDEGLFGRRPIFNSLEALVDSYFDPYIDNKTSKVTGYQVAHLDECGVNWRSSGKSVFKAERFLIDIWHHPVKKQQDRYEKIFEIVSSGRQIPADLSWL